MFFKSIASYLIGFFRAKTILLKYKGHSYTFRRLSRRISLDRKVWVKVPRYYSESKRPITIILWLHCYCTNQKRRDGKSECYANCISCNYGYVDYLWVPIYWRRSFITFSRGGIWKSKFCKIFHSKICFHFNPFESSHNKNGLSQLKCCFGNTEIFSFNFFITSDNTHFEMKNHLKWNIPFSLFSKFFLTIFFLYT